MDSPKFSFQFWEASTFDYHHGCKEAVIPDEIILAAVAETPENVKIAVETFFMEKPFTECNYTESSDALVINAIFWIMNQTGFTDWGGIMDAYLMLPSYLEVFRRLRDEEEWEPLSVEFDVEEWNATYDRS